jgi:hypothetical protein
VDSLKTAEEILKLLEEKSDQEKSLILALVKMTLSKGDRNSPFGQMY